MKVHFSHPQRIPVQGRLARWTGVLAAAAVVAAIAAHPAVGDAAAGDDSQAPGDAATVALPEVSVTAPAEQSYSVDDATAATKTDTPIMQTPVSVQVIPQQVLKDQQVIQLDDALQNVSGVIQTNDSYGTGDSFSIRGFDQAELTYEDGLKLDQYTTSGLTRSLANIDRIEVVKGPASVLYGRAEPGGLVDIVTKKPLDTPYYALEQQFGSYEFYRTTLDATGPLNPNKTFLYRFNLDYENSGSFRDFIHGDRLFLFPTLQWKPNEENQVTAEFKYGTGTQVLDNGIPFLPNGTPANVPISRNYVEPDANRNTTTEYSAKLLASHDFDEHWRLRLLYKTEYHDSPVPNDQLYNGDAAASGELQRLWTTETYFHHWTNQVVFDQSGRFVTFGITHSALLGFDYYYQTGAYNYNDTGFVTPPPSINIYHPVYGQPFPPLSPMNYGTAQSGQSAYGAYLQDQMELPWNVHLLAGFRYDQAYTYENYGGPAYTGNTSTFDDPSLTPRFGILWQPIPQVSPYASYTENFGATPLGNTPVPGQVLPPESAQQYEAGIKTEWLEKRLSATASIYQLTKKNIPTADPSNPSYTIAIGEARSRGIEFELAGMIMPGWNIIGGYSYIDCVTTKDTNTPSLEGLRFPSVPYNSGSLWTTYEVQRGAVTGLKFGVGVLGRSGEVAWESPDGTSYSADRIPGFAIVNTMASYDWHLGKTRMRAQLNINNLFDKTYFASVNPSQAQPGAPLNLLGSLRVEL